MGGKIATFPEGLSLPTPPKAPSPRLREPGRNSRRGAEKKARHPDADPQRGRRSRAGSRCTVRTRGLGRGRVPGRPLSGAAAGGDRPASEGAGDPSQAPEVGPEVRRVPSEGRPWGACDPGTLLHGPPLPNDRGEGGGQRAQVSTPGERERGVRAGCAGRLANPESLRPSLL